MGTTVLGRFKLQGTPPQPAPVLSGTIPGSDAVPNPQVNPGFLYTGDKAALNYLPTPARRKMTE